MKKNTLYKDPVTGEYRYNGKWWNYYPHDEIEADEAAWDDHWEREQDRRRDEDRPL